MKDMMKWLTKERVIQLILIIWVIFSAGYIARDLVNNAVNQKIKNAYQAGYADSVRALMSESQKCEPIKVYEGEEQVELISIECLQQAVNSQNASEGTETTE